MLLDLSIKNHEEKNEMPEDNSLKRPRKNTGNIIQHSSADDCSQLFQNYDTDNENMNTFYHETKTITTDVQSKKYHKMNDYYSSNGSNTSQYKKFTEITLLSNTTQPSKSPN
ncbi:hypothetical protein DMUE_1301 [Dictyocoela muelleri]|nr:hypothetical protein DMUE_1301 [Dictyocoela muelleri]